MVLYRIIREFHFLLYFFPGPPGRPPSTKLTNAGAENIQVVAPDNLNSLLTTLQVNILRITKSSYQPEQVGKQTKGPRHKL